MSKAHSAAATPDVQLDEPVSLHPENVSRGGANINVGHAEQIWELWDLGDQAAGKVSAPQRIQLFHKKTGLDVMTTVLEAQKPIELGLAAILDNYLFSAAFTAGFDSFKDAFSKEKYLERS